MPKALIIGITGQDGSFLSELLLEKDYEVHGIVRRASTDNRSRLADFEDKLHLHYGDLSDSGSLVKLLDKIGPDEVYNLGAMSDVGISFHTPVYCADVTGCGAIRVLEALRQLDSPARYYQASSSEMFGSSPPPQSEQTPFHPRSPYGCSKVFAYWATTNYREAYHMFAANGILFNHESCRRGENFVTRKICKAVARIKRGKQDALYLGNLSAKRDWGFAGDYVRAMWLMLQHSEPDDFVIATGESHTVAEFAEAAFSHVDLDWHDYVRVDSSLFRPSEVEFLLGDPSKAKRVLGWEPQVDFRQLARMMVEAELEHE